ncbi:hypothetical protein [Arthrobacter sp. MMS18-M83]|uniref:hypothetical protein n=1 Tax=Arthrobacter sp. MMS18-M83 TaxID=2996261 RepID=UPI00227ABB39|nr:hypothetical protein [Arthrobacter sp. MMS18-M83]WAH95868.1 hypothetical protein OW521_15655 [Arthrobacter sp. MMS18-M83]
MNVHRYSSRTAAAIAAAVLLVCTSTPADAATTANATSASQTASSGTWGAVASLSTTAPYGSGPLTLTFTNNGKPATPSFVPQYFTVGNTGTLPITAASYGGSTSAPSSVQFFIESCSGTWDEPTGACLGGTATTILTTPFGTSTIPDTPGPAPATSGAGLRLRASVASTGNVSKSAILTLTLSISVDRTQVRSATTTGG